MLNGICDTVCLYTCSAVLGVKKGGPLCVRPRLSVCLRAFCPAVCALMVVLLQVLQALLTAGALTAAALIRDSEAATGQRGRVQDNNQRFDSLFGRSLAIRFSLPSTIEDSIPSPVDHRRFDSVMLTPPTQYFMRLSPC